MFRLENEVVVLIGLEELGKWLADRVVADDVLELHMKIGPPLSEVVVDVDDRNLRGLGALFQLSQLSRGGERGFQQLFRAAEVEIVYYVNEDERDRALIGDAAVEVGILCGH